MNPGEETGGDVYLASYRKLFSHPPLPDMARQWAGHAAAAACTGVGASESEGTGQSCQGRSCEGR